MPFPTEPMPKQQYLNIVRVAREEPLEVVTWLQTCTYNTLRRLNVARDLSKAVTRTPRGSRQVDPGSFRDWTAKLTKEDTDAIAQVVAIDATCVKRTARRG